MKKGFALGMVVFFIALAAVVISLMSCGGGGGGSSSGSSPSADRGSVAVFLADGPADDYDHIWVTITEVSLIPAGGNGAPEVIFQSAAGLEVDLLEYRDEDFLLTLKKEVPAGLYAKIRLIVSDIRVVPKQGLTTPTCANLEIKLPSGRIDLNPREPFRVTRGGMIAIRLDIDANKSINLHQAGNSGKCIFRPVVFVDIQEQMPIARCPKVLSGTIESLVKDSGNQVVGFFLNLQDHRGTIEVSLPSEAKIINSLGVCATPNDLKAGEQVKVRGKLASSGVFQASVVVVGQLLEVTGTVTTNPTFLDSTFTFNFTPLDGQELIGPRTVQGAACTLTIRGCDALADPKDIQAGMKIRIFGKEVSETQNGQTTVTLRAAAIILVEQEIVGQITSIGPATNGVLATIQQNGGSLVSVFIPEGAPIFLQGDGAVPPGLLCVGRQVRVFLKPGISTPLTAALVKVESEKHEGTVTLIGSDPRTLTVELVGGSGSTETVYIEPGATILNSQGVGQTLVSFEDIKVGDSIAYFGLVGCGADTRFHSFVVVIGN